MSTATLYQGFLLTGNSGAQYFVVLESRDEILTYSNLLNKIRFFERFLLFTVNNNLLHCKYLRTNYKNHLCFGLKGVYLYWLVNDQKVYVSNDNDLRRSIAESSPSYFEQPLNIPTCLMHVEFTFFRPIGHDGLV